MEVNKEQAEKCKTIGATALKQAQYDRAVKFFKKSLHLYPLPGVEALLSTAERMAKGESSSGGAGGSGSSSNHTNGASSASANSSSFQGGASTSSASAARASAPASGGRTCTPAMEETVDRILKAKEGGRGAHYRVLGISQNATESEIKKGYRKTAIKVHPDKNSAPHSDEAFKAVGLAYATLSDPQKRTIYDRYGEEDPDNRGGGMGGMRRGPGGVHFRPGQDVNPEDIFNMFFGGGMGGMGGGMHRGPGGVHFSTNFGGMPRGFRQQQQQRQRGEQQQRQEPEAPGLANLIQLLPFLIIMLLSFFNMNNDYSAGGGGGGSSSNQSPGLNRYFTLTVRSRK